MFSFRQNSKKNFYLIGGYFNNGFGKIPTDLHNTGRFYNFLSLYGNYYTKKR